MPGVPPVPPSVPGPPVVPKGPDGKPPKGPDGKVVTPTGPDGKPEGEKGPDGKPKPPDSGKQTATFFVQVIFMELVIVFNLKTKLQLFSIEIKMQSIVL